METYPTSHGNCWLLGGVRGNAALDDSPAGTMINVMFIFPDGHQEMEYDVHPKSQDEPIPLPLGAISFVVYLGTRAVRFGEDDIERAST